MPTYKLQEQNFEMHANNAKRLNITVVDQDDAIVDITGAAISMSVSKEPGGAAEFTQAGVVDNGSGGLAHIDISEADVATLHGVWYYDVELVDASNKPYTIIYGWMTILKNTAP